MTEASTHLGRFSCRLTDMPREGYRGTVVPRILSLRIVAALWISAHLGSLAAVVLALALNVNVCGCPQGVGASCPMHQHQTTRKTGCGMESTTGRAPSLVTGVLTLVGLLPASTAWARPQPARTLSLGLPPLSLQSLSGPDAPPPRA